MPQGTSHRRKYLDPQVPPQISFRDTLGPPEPNDLYPNSTKKVRF